MASIDLKMQRYGLETREGGIGFISKVNTRKHTTFIGKVTQKSRFPMKHWLYTLLCLCFWLSTKTQNLVPNGDFEIIDCPTNNINSITETATWYACSGADAYWLHEDCPLDPDIAESVFFINTATEPYSGVGYISLEGVMTRNGYIASEGVGIELTAPLQAGIPYFFQVAALYQPERIAGQHPGNACPPLPPRFMEVYVGSEKIQVRRESDILDVTTGISSNAELVLVDSTSLEENFQANQWYLFSSCFIASGGETDLGIMGSNFQVDANNGCIAEGEPGAVYLFGHSLDAVQLVEMPTSIAADRNICENGGWVDLEGVVSPVYFDYATFLWEDGCTLARRVIRRPGIYQVEMILPCITIPITLDISIDEFCSAVMYTEEMPESITKNIVICTDEGPANINLLDYTPETLRADISFAWADGYSGTARVLNNSAVYEIWASTPCFAFPMTLHAELFSCETKIFVPNAFSPNLDGINDQLRPFINSPWPAVNYQFQIFDRWGQLLFQADNPNVAWDGKVKNKLADQGVFLWSLEYDTGQENGGKIKLTGDVMLLY
jgi:gliding motility-associated-like protein